MDSEKQVGPHVCTTTWSSAILQEWIKVVDMRVSAEVLETVAGAGPTGLFASLAPPGPPFPS